MIQWPIILKKHAWVLKFHMCTDDTQAQWCNSAFCRRRGNYFLVSAMTQFVMCVSDYKSIPPLQIVHGRPQLCERIPLLALLLHIIHYSLHCFFRAAERDTVKFSKGKFYPKPTTSFMMQYVGIQPSSTHSQCAMCI